MLLTEHDLFPAEQFAYRAHHSTEDAVLLAVDQFYEAADQHLHTGVVLIDTSKAFDKVQHQTLLQDLFERGVSSTALDWFADYLSARRQCMVTANGTRSEETACTCGIPQGSVLGPILFAIYTRCVASVAEPVRTLMFADDIMLYLSHASAHAINITLSAAVSAVARLLDAKGLILNTGKTQVLFLFYFLFYFFTLFYFAKSKREFLPNDKVAKILRGKKKRDREREKRRKEKSVYALEMIVSWKSDPLSNMAFATVPCSQRAIA